MARVDAQRLRNERVRRCAFTNAWIGCRRVQENVIETVNRLPLLRPPRLEPHIAEAGDAVYQQFAKIVRRDGIAWQDAARRMQRLTPRVDAPARASEQVCDRKPRAIRQFRQCVAELLQNRNAGIVLVIIGPYLAGELLDEAQCLDPQRLVIEARR